MNKKNVVYYLIRHAPSVNGFKLNNNSTPEEAEWNKPITEESKGVASNVGREIGNDFIQYASLHIPGDLEIVDLANTSDCILSLDLVNSGRLRSKQTLLEVSKGLSIDNPERFFREDFNLGYVLDSRYVKAAKTAAKEGIYSSTIAFFEDVSPNRFFKEQGIVDPTRTYSIAEIRRNMKTAIRTAADRSMFAYTDLGLMVSHEPVLSMLTTYLMNDSVEGVGGKWKELEYSTIHIRTGIEKFPEIGFNFRDKQADIGPIIYK